MTRWRRYGPGLWMAGVMVAAALVLNLAVVPRWRAQADAADMQADGIGQRWRALRQNLQAAAAAGVPAAGPAPLPADGAARERLSGLLLLAQRHGLVLGRTEQRLVAEPRLGHAHWSVQMPARASYAQLRGFLQAALQSDPALGLEALRLQRDDPADRSLNIELAWALYQALPAGAGP